MDIGDVIPASKLRVSRQNGGLVYSENKFDKMGFQNGSQNAYIAVSNPEKSVEEVLQLAVAQSLTFVITDKRADLHYLQLVIR